MAFKQLLHQINDSGPTFRTPYVDYLGSVIVLLHTCSSRFYLFSKNKKGGLDGYIYKDPITVFLTELSDWSVIKLANLLANQIVPLKILEQGTYIFSYQHHPSRKS